MDETTGSREDQVRTQGRSSLVGWASLGLTLAGWAIGLYLTIAHFNSPQALYCADTGVVNCAKVTTSAQSYLLGVPVAILGLVYFTLMALVNNPWAWASAKRSILWGRLIAASAGLFFVVWLISAEAFIIKNICLWCTGVHIITVVLFVMTLWATRRRQTNAS